MDDILIFSPDEETHLKHIKIIFKKLQEAQLKIKLEKCHFFKKHVQYLGHVVSAIGIQPMAEKLTAINNLAPPTNVHKVQQVMGLVGYYRNFIPNFAEISKDIIALTKKGCDFDWSEKCQKAFNYLKKCLTEHPILIYPDPNKEYHLFTDASKSTWCAILMQEVDEDDKLHPIAFQSGTFKGSQLSWATLTKEAYAIYMAFCKFSFYLEGAKTTLHCDHAPLKKFLEGKTMNNKVNIWGVELSNFNITF